MEEGYNASKHITRIVSKDKQSQILSFAKFFIWRFVCKVQGRKKFQRV